jgi:hypothetical protein
MRQVRRPQEHIASKHGMSPMPFDVETPVQKVLKRKRAVCPAARPSAAPTVQMLQERIAGHFEAHLPKGPQAASVRQAVYDYICKHRHSILAHGAEKGSLHDANLHQPLRELACRQGRLFGAADRIPAEVARAGAQLFIEREEAADNALADGLEDISRISRLCPARTFAEPQTLLQETLRQHLPQGAEWSQPRAQMLNYISRRRDSIIAIGAADTTMHYRALWEAMRGPPLAKAASGAEERGFSRLQRPPIPPGVIVKAARLFRERERAANLALAQHRALAGGPQSSFLAAPASNLLEHLAIRQLIGASRSDGARMPERRKGASGKSRAALRAVRARDGQRL